MYLGMDGKYSAFEELMHYYHLNFYVYYFLLLIVFVNCIKVIVNFTSVKKGKVSNINSGNMDLLISILAGIGLGYGMLFQGVLSDISSKYFKIWGNKMFVLCIASFILFIIQLICTLRIRDIKNKH
ncbi:hypothetical protein [Tepidimicrobium xylanilyticum]|uniref:Uncharacterized protein n=1 Tax=Tepidimicrobium xylanilyticum TaxID=1123352 RepID=A0A1H3APE2_9FIRM|nr:hypothetical protein [Tepidimicrobium xylanilyticum]SDX30709.1 hypothetical protein SAMN05660923_02076 [Tepidimicrobium xylanilyticum]